MDKIGEINQMLEATCRLNGLADVRLDKYHTAALRLADGTLLAFEWLVHAEQLLVSLVMMQLPPEAEQRLALCEALLWFGCLSRRNSVPALHLPTSQAVLRMTMNAESLTVSGLESGIHDLLNERREVFSYLQTAGVASHRSIRGLTDSVRYSHAAVFRNRTRSSEVD